MRSASGALALTAAILLSACTPSPSGEARSTGSSPSATSTNPTPSPSPGAHGLAGCPAPQPEGALTVLARPGGAPDDLAPADGGGLWVSDESHGRITRLDASGAVVFRIDDPRGPEGIVPQPDGTLIVAEQVPDRVVVIHPPSSNPIAVLLQLQPVSGRLGIDSIEADRAAGRLLLPDSPRGALRAIPIGGGPPATLATGLGRPVDAIVAPDGFIYVTAESAPGLVRVPAGGGAAAAVGTLADLDDVLAVGDLLYVTDMADGTVRAVDPRSGEDRVLVSGVAQPQGLASLAGGRLALSDSSRGLIAEFSPC